MARFRIGCIAATLALLVASRSAHAQDIAPPPPIDPNVPGSPTSPSPGTDPAAQQAQATNQQLDEAEREDSGRNFELFWVDGWIGGSYIDMQQFSQSSLAIEKSSSGGPMFSLGAGVRFVVLVLGLRAKYNALSSFNMWQLNGELGLKFPISKIDILIGAHGGYSFVGRLDDAGSAGNTGVPSNSDAVKIRGFNVGLDLGVDYYVSPIFSVGAGAWVDGLFLNRPPVDKPAGFDQLTQQQKDAITNSPLYQQSGQSAGLDLGGALRLGLHFGL
jgi:hypothetical protein